MGSFRGGLLALSVSAFALLTSVSSASALTQVSLQASRRIPRSFVQVLPPTLVPPQAPQVPTTPQAPQATSETPEKLAAVLKFVFDNEALKFGWPANYTAMWCPTNVFNLLRRLSEANVDLSEAKVLYILPAYYAQKKGESDIRPRQARSGREGPTREWTFHVVLQIKNQILDLDFTNDPVIVETDEYFARMFGKGPLATQKSKQEMYFRSIPATEYLASYSGNWEWYLGGASGRFNAENLESLFQDQGPDAVLEFAANKTAN